MTDLLRSIRALNKLQSTDLAEPFAGGAGASLSLLFGSDTKQIWLNDADPAIFAFWWSILHRSEAFIKKLRDTPITIAEWHLQRAIYLKKGSVARLDRGFAAFFLNRCNRSGIIINGGPIGGYDQQGDWKLDVRFNKKDLEKRLKKVAEFSSRIHLSDSDGIDFLDEVDQENTTQFIDPPYYAKGRLLYQNLLTSDYHVRLAKRLRSHKNDAWVLTYDDCPEIRYLYEKWANVRSFSLRYTAATKRSGKELLISPKWMVLPVEQRSGSIVW